MRAVFFSRTFTVTVPAAFALTEPVATMMALLPRSLRRFAATDPVTMMVPALGARTFSRRPAADDSATTVRLAGSVTTRRVAGVVGGVVGAGGPAGAGGAGFSWATDAPPIEGLERWRR